MDSLTFTDAPGPVNTVSRLDRASAQWQRFKSLLKRRWWFILLAASIGMCLAAYQVAGKTTEYTSQASLVAGSKIDLSNSTINIRESAVTDFFETNIQILNSQQVRQDAADRVRITKPELKECLVTIDVTRPRGAGIFQLTATGTEEKYTVEYLNALIDAFISYREDINKERSNKALNVIMEKLIAREKSFTDEQKQLDEFLDKNKAISLDLQKSYNGWEEQLNAKKQEYLKLNSEVESLGKLTQANIEEDIVQRQRLAQSDPAKNGNLTGSSLAEGLNESERNFLSTKARLDVLKSQRTSLIEVFRDKHPKVLEIDAEIASNTQLLGVFQQQTLQQAEKRREGLQIRVAKLTTEIKDFEQRALDMNAKLSEFKRLNTKVEGSKELYGKLIDTVRELKDSYEMTIDTLSIMQRASPAFQKKPEVWRPIIMGAIAGLIIGTVLLVVLDRLDDRMTSYSDFQINFPNVAVLGQIPDQSMKGDSPLLKPNDDRHLYAEAFRNIRSSILFKNWGGKIPKLIMLTSAVPNEGKTTIAGNLATTMAIAGARILLIDGDLRRGGLNEIFGLAAKPGFSEILTSNADWRETVVPTKIRNLTFLPRGEALDQTSEYFLSQKADDFLKEIASEYDYIIFDSAPVLVADDTGSFAPKMDTIIFVVRMSSTMARLTNKALNQLQDRQAHVGGIILNRANANLREYSYYNYASYYTIQPTQVTTPTSNTVS